MRSIIVALLLVSCAPGCGPRRAVLMSQETVDRLGRRERDVTRAEAFQATLAALGRLGFGIQSSEPERGLIRTARKPIRPEDTSSWSARTWGTPVLGHGRGGRLEREYWIIIEEPSPGHVVMTANPYLYSNGEDVSGREIWDLEEERRAWGQLFEEIDRELARRPPSPAPPVHEPAPDSSPPPSGTRAPAPPGGDPAEFDNPFDARPR